MALAAPRVLSAQGVPLGPEFRVSTFTTSNQGTPAAASDSAGNFVVMWSSDDQDGSGRGVFGQRYTNTGTPLGGEFRANSDIGLDQDSPSVASDAAGTFVVVWESYSQDGSGNGVFAQRFASTGVPMGTEFRVNTLTTLGQQLPSVACDPAGNFVVVWQHYVQPGESEIVGQRFASTGTPLGAEFRVNTYTTSIQGAPSAASDSAGNLVIVWQSNSQDGHGMGIFGQRYSSSGAPLGGEFRINTYTTLDEMLPSVASDSLGHFVVAWTTNEMINSEVSAQRFANTGTPVGGEFRVNTNTPGIQTDPVVRSDAAGHFVIAWSSGAYFPTGGVFAQRYASTGSPLGGEFRANTNVTVAAFYAPTIAADPAGDFVIAWQNLGDGSGGGIFAQRYNMIVPVELQDFRID